MKPMLASAVGETIKFPVLASPKLDGIRCIIIDGVACGRSLKPIPNKRVQELFGRPELNGLDGELIVGDACAISVFQVTTSGVMRRGGTPDVAFMVFDNYLAEGGYESRMEVVNEMSAPFRRVHVVCTTHLSSIEELDAMEQDYLEEGYEGVMIRSIDGPYKHGRSTVKEGYLLKVKRFTDSEAIVTGFTEQMENTNKAITNELGYSERSSHKAGMVGKGTLGSLTVRDIGTGVEFDIGTGFDAKTRQELWNKQGHLLGLIVKYKSQPTGVKDKPRFPVFLGFRNSIDMSK